MKKVFTIVLILAAIGLAGFYGAKWYYRSQPARDVAKEQGIKVTAQQIFDEFTNNETEGNRKYLSKAVEVSGEVLEARKNQDNRTVVVLKTSDPIFGVNCTFKEEPGDIKPGDNITFKGICTGFISDVVINEGVLVKK